MADMELTPLMRQYREIKQGYADAILLFRVGDFYEMFYEDAVEAADLLSIALTSRDKSSATPVPLCGVPYHAATGYIAKLLKAGRTVALCEQVEDPKLAKGLVRREVVRLYTPGTLIDHEFLSPSESNILAAVAVSTSKGPSDPTHMSLGIAALDLSTGHFSIEEFTGQHAALSCLDELARLQPRELLLSDSPHPEFKKHLVSFSGPRLSQRPAAWFNLEDGRALLQGHFSMHSLDGFGCQGFSVSVAAAAAVLRYVQETQPSARLDHIKRLMIRRQQDAMHLDSATIQNLELVRPMSASPSHTGTRELTLLAVLDRTTTAMGTRLLREWILRPLLDSTLIQARLDSVEELKERADARVGMRSALRGVQDICRLSSRISLGVATPRDMLALKESMAVLPELLRYLETLVSPLLAGFKHSWDNAQDVYDLIEQAILPEAPPSSRDGGLIKEGYHAGVDELRKAGREGKGWITALEARERQRTGIESLKIRYNQIFGYYIEVTKTNLAKVPNDYVRKQTLVNAERFMTSELRDLEERVTGAESKLNRLEYELFENLRMQLLGETHRLQTISESLATLDAFASLSETAALNHYVRPTVDDSGMIVIKEGRHPVVERLDSSDGFVPNDTSLNLSGERLLILTGPNMAGKSTYLRQVALITLLAQIGSFVPAKEAHIGLVDRIFTRVGASDNLSAGQSTFMVEMTETAQILNCATNKSLILLDEIGRGTSTYDGLSIAWAVAEYIQNPERLGTRTLFATHYHEMTELETLREGVRNYRVAVHERDGDVLFLRKIVPGGADRSYGIHVAKLAGLPTEVILRAQEVLLRLEQPSNTSLAASPTQQLSKSDASLPRPHPLLEEVRQMNLFSMTPLDALNTLADIQRRLESPQDGSTV